LGFIPVSWSLSVAATTACTFFKAEVDDGYHVHFGFLAYKDPDEGCTFIDDAEFRSDLAFGFAVFNCLLTTLGVVGIFLMQFILTRGRKRTWTALRISIYVSLWCCMFTFYIKQESEVCDYFDCSLRGSGIAQVFNVLFLIAISGMLFLTPFGEDNAMNANQRTQGLEHDDQNVSITENFEAPTSRPGFEKETRFPDGSIKREIETTNPDGSKTITITTTTTIKKPTLEDKEAFMIASDEDSSSRDDEDSSSSDDEEPSPESNDGEEKLAI
jgi:hypothetical protein